MKKLLVMILAVCLVMNLSACSSKEEIVGGYQEASDKTITPELKEMFDKASEAYVGMNLEPIELISTQVVAGTNYKFLCNGTAVVPNGETKKVVVTVYEDLKGNVEITNVEDYKE